MRRETFACLTDIERALKLILQAVSGMSSDDFTSNWEKQSAVERQLLIIGEALVRIRGFEPGVLDQINDANRIIGLRNLLAHGYDAVDSNALFEYASKYVSKLLLCVLKLLGANGN